MEPTKFMKSRLAGFLQWHVVEPLNRLHCEQVFQGIFANQCRKLGIDNDFYPVGAAASYSLLYLLARIFDENDVRRIVELGSGQSTLLIDRIRKEQSTHVCYENDEAWFGHVRTKVSRCDYRLRPLKRTRTAVAETEWYGDPEMHQYDLLLVDGPRGVDEYSRVGCLALVQQNESDDQIIIIDDAQRPGEQQTVRAVLDLLRNKRPGTKFFHRELMGRTTQALIVSGRYAHLRFYF